MRESIRVEDIENAFKLGTRDSLSRELILNIGIYVETDRERRKWDGKGKLC